MGDGEEGEEGEGKEGERGKRPERVDNLTNRRVIRSSNPDVMPKLSMDLIGGDSE